MALPFGGGRLPLTPTNPHSVSGPHTLPSTSLTMLPRDLGVDGAPLPVLRVDPLVGFVDLDHMAIAVDHQVESVDHRRLLSRERYPVTSSREAWPRNSSRPPVVASARSAS